MLDVISRNAFLGIIKLDAVSRRDRVIFFVDLVLAYLNRFKLRDLLKRQLGLDVLKGGRTDLFLVLIKRPVEIFEIHGKLKSLHLHS